MEEQGTTYKGAAAAFEKVLGYFARLTTAESTSRFDPDDDEYDRYDRYDKYHEDGAMEAEAMDVEPANSVSTQSSRTIRSSESADISVPDRSAETSATSLSTEPESPKTGNAQARRKSSVPIITAAAFEYPRFRYEGWEPPLPISTEHDALRDIKNEWSSKTNMPSEDQLVICDLDDFTFYVPSWRKYHAYELRTLDTLSSPQTNELMLSGILNIGGVRRYVQDVSFKGFSVEGYGRDESADIELYIRSSAASKDKQGDVWYRLRDPASEYRPYHAPFLWVASFAKHVLDFLDDCVSDSDGDSSTLIGLADFKSNFHQWITMRFPHDLAFQKWIKAFGNKLDFRAAFHANAEFLWHQATDTTDEDERKSRLKHPVWNDCGFNGINLEKIDVICEKTVATPFVYNSFSSMYFGKELEQVNPTPSVFEAQSRRKRQLGFAKDKLFHPQIEEPQAKVSTTTSRRAPIAIKVGDVISVPPDQNGKWRKNNTYYAYVQGVRHKQAYDELTVTWLYCPEDTTIGWSRYQFSKELFFSDHCNCRDQTKLKSTEVLAVHTVEWLPTDVNTDREFFIRTKYRSDGSGFDSLKLSDRVCRCKDESTANIRLGDTVYMATNMTSRTPRLDPVVIVGHDKIRKQVTVRRLLRAKQDCAQFMDPTRAQLTPKNELTWTDELITVSASRIDRKCYIRFFSEKQVQSGNLPFPYNYDGRWDFWYIASRLVSHEGSQNRLVPITSPLPMVEGLDMSSPPTKKPLRGLSLFSGGGSFDRGLEAAGGVAFKDTVDFCEWAVLTQKANAEHSSDCRFYKASVDDFLKAAILNSDLTRIPSIGSVQIVAGGSPCQGCSTLQRDKFSAESLRNVSHITTICSYVDVYRPEYAILENVVNVIDRLKGYERESILSQLIATLVSMGYQTQYWVQSAWGDGSCQRRSRLFIAIAAPNVKPITRPEPTHRDPPAQGMNRPKHRALGTLPCGVRFGYQDPDIAVPFDGVSAKEALDDLPNIASATSRICVPYPDHRMSDHMSEKHRAIVKHIPTLPFRADYQYAIDKKLLPPSLIEKRMEIGRAFQRIHPHGLMPTITTKTNYRCSRSGNIIHYQQHRPISIREAARTQGWHDDEVIIGAPDMQYRIVGNGVDRAMSTAQGFQFRFAWESSPAETSGQLQRSSLISHNRDLVQSKGLKNVGSEPVGDEYTRVKHVGPLPVNRKRSVVAVVVPSGHPQTKRTKPTTQADDTARAHVNRNGSVVAVVIPPGAPQAKRPKATTPADNVDRAKSIESEGRRSSRLTGQEVDLASVSWDKMTEKVVRKTQLSELERN